VVEVVNIVVTFVLRIWSNTIYFTLAEFDLFKFVKIKCISNLGLSSLKALSNLDNSLQIGLLDPHCKSSFVPSSSQVVQLTLPASNTCFCHASMIPRPEGILHDEMQRLAQTWSRYRNLWCCCVAANIPTIKRIKTLLCFENLIFFLRKLFVPFVCWKINFFLESEFWKNKFWKCELFSDVW